MLVLFSSKVNISALVISLSLLLVSCGSILGSKKKDKESAAASEDTVDVAIAIEQPLEAGMLLTATSVSYSGVVTGCKSGRTATFDDATTSVKLLLGDSSCVAKLATISVLFADNTTAEFTADSRYTFRAGTASVLAPNSAGRALKIAVSNQLPSVIVATPAAQITMSLSFVEAGESQTASVNTANAGIDLDVNQTIPYEISGISLNVDSATGGGAFDLRMNCYELVEATGTCEGYTQDGFTTAIAVDTYKTDGVGRNLTLPECIAVTARSNKKSPSVTFLPADNDSLAPNGGLRFAIVGPKPLCSAANKDLIIATRHSTGESCKWWRVAVTCPQ